MDKKLYTARLSHLMVDAIYFIICISIVMFASYTYGVCINVEHISVSVERRQLLCYVCALKEAKQNFFLMDTLGLITYLPLTKKCGICKCCKFIEMVKTISINRVLSK